jgi:hypothetical protein
MGDSVAHPIENLSVIKASKGHAPFGNLMVQMSSL